MLKRKNNSNVKQFGMSAEASPSVLDLFMQQRRVAELSKEPELSLDEINTEIRAARKDLALPSDT